MAGKRATKQEILALYDLSENHSDGEIAAKLGRSESFVWRQRQKHGIHRRCQWTIWRMHKATGYSRYTLRIIARLLHVGRRLPNRALVFAEGERDAILRKLRTYSPQEEANRRLHPKLVLAAKRYHAKHPDRAATAPGTERGRQTVLKQEMRSPAPGRKVRLQVQYRCECGNIAWTDNYRFLRWVGDKCYRCPVKGHALHARMADRRQRAGDNQAPWADEREFEVRNAKEMP